MPEQGDLLERVREDDTPAAGDLLALYRALVQTRVLDERMPELQRAGEIAFHPPSQGEEASWSGAVSALEPDEWVFAGVRAATVAFQRGMTLQAWLHQAYGTSRDAALGRRFPGFPAFREGRIASSSSSSGAGIAHAAGFAWASRMKREGRATLCLFGEGSRSQPDYHTGLNFAGVMAAPAVFVCRCRPEGGAAGLAGEARRAGEAYGIPGEAVDGTDVLAVRRSVAAAAGRARAGEGPTLLLAGAPPEFGGEQAAAALRAVLEARGAWDAERDAALREEIGEAMERAVAEARRAAAPQAGTLFDEVYERPDARLEAQRRELLEAAGTT